ncbi:hypothetical protein M2360_003551 [Rhizobium sp. SG_E_25_P2]|uniref:nuclear transport factor 2 family protein n=1 Tax=Rhizobium sp. SG_E_25_P2 TaxID=2879942 RepID=UPI0024751629|nr:nuclear transport factor 2 family protein [Rhizobium sp. SG_E_25_P2]MDH6268146.1 hypothetical protein [Rhizobium sp. SG_E_25_P2]
MHWRRNCAPDLRVFPADAEISILDLPRYTQAQLANGIQENGYSETVGKRNIRILGDVAVAEQYLTMNFPSGAQNAAIDFFSLVRTQDRWRIVSVVSDNVGPGEN